MLTAGRVLLVGPLSGETQARHGRPGTGSSRHTAKNMMPASAITQHPRQAGLQSLSNLWRPAAVPHTPAR